jgi:hypothetical protein
MKKLTLILLIFCVFTTKAQNLILNGSFELHNSTECFNEIIFINEYENTLSYSTEYGEGNATVGLLKDSCLTCLPQNYWGGGVQEGLYMLLLAGEKKTFSDGSIYKKQGEISLELTSFLSNEVNYKLSFWTKKPPNTFYPTYCLKDLKNNYISVGISNTDDAFGTHLITSPYGDTLWQQHSIVFNTQNAEEYITVKVGVNDTIDYAVFIDHFVVTETEEQPNAIFELNTNTKQLLKIVDVLGRESKPNSNTPLFYIYSDGTVEKKLIIE